MAASGSKFKSSIFKKPGTGPREASNNSTLKGYFNLKSSVPMPAEKIIATQANDPYQKSVFFILEK